MKANDESALSMGGHKSGASLGHRGATGALAGGGGGGGAGGGGGGGGNGQNSNQPTTLPLVQVRAGIFNEVDVGTLEVIIV